MPPRDVRAETGLARAPGLWATGPVQLELPLEVRGISGAIRSTGRLSLSPDLDVLAWICERWMTNPIPDHRGIVRFTVYDLALDLYGKRPGGKNRRDLAESLRRLYRVEVSFTDHDAIDGQPMRGSQTLSRLLYDVRAETALLDAGSDPARLGALRGSTVAVRLSDWLRDSLMGGHFTYLRWDILRQLDGHAKRLWVYLAAERYKPIGDDLSATHVGLGGPALATLGLDGYARHRDARAALKRAGDRIVKADPRYQSVTVERRPGGYALVAIRRTRALADGHAEARAKIRASLEASKACPN